MGTLYVVATPIGNLGDLSGRAAETLRAVQLVAAEDTRVTRKLLTRAGSKARLISYHENSPPQRLQELLDHLDTRDIALVTDAGTPGISDPGAALVAAAVNAGHTVTPVPGPSAVTTALSVCGFPSDRFMFLGFPPRRKSERARFLGELRSLTVTSVVLEAPHRIQRLLKEISEALPDRRLAVCRELTKFHEEVFRGTAAEAVVHFTEPRGEFVLVLSPAQKTNASNSDEEVRAVIERHAKAGLAGRSLVEAVIVETGEPRSVVYALVMDKMHASGS